MYNINRDIRKPTKAINRFPEIIQECWQQYHDDIATGDRTNLPATVDVVLRFYDAIWNRKSVNLRHVLAISKDKALTELDSLSGALIRSSVFAGYGAEDTALSVCKSTFVDYSHAVGVAMCVTILTPGATFRDIAGLRESVTNVLETVYGHIGCATPYQCGRGNMYITKYMVTCARSVIGLYSHVPAILSHVEEEVGE